MKTIAIISQKGGAGKTTMAVHLAVEAQSRGFEAAIFDLDPQASAASWGDKRTNQTLPVVSAQAARLPNLLEQAEAQNADFIIIDSAPNADAASLAAARAADLILVPCRPSAFDLNAIGTTLNLASVAGKPAWVLLNAVPPQGKLGEEAQSALREAKVQVIEPVIHHLIAFSHAVNDGRTAAEYDPKCKAATEVTALFDWIAQEIDLKASRAIKKRA